MSEPCPRLLLMTTDTVGGVWTYSLELCAELGRHGVRVTLATMGLPTERQERQAALLPGLKLLPSAYRPEWTDDPWDDVARAGEWLLGLAARLRPDVVHLNGYAHAALPFPAPVLVTGHSCRLSWWRAVHGADAPPSFDTYRRHVTLGLRGAGLVVAPTRAMRDLLVQHYGPLPATRVIHHGRALSPDLESAAPAKERLIFAAGRLWDEAKNIAALDRIAGRLQWPVCTAGANQDPSGRTRALTGVRDLGVLTPREVERWMARASVYALPARYEPFGMSVLEAGLRGCALVLGDIPSLREIWDDAAAFVPPDDEGALEATLLDLIRRPQRRSVLAVRARRRARRYTAAAMGAAYLSAYRSLLKPERSVRAS